MHIALVYDWVTTPYGGAEKVLLALHQAFPQAPLYTSVADLTRAPWAREFDVRPSWLQRIPGLRSHHRWSAPLQPLAFEAFNFDDYEVVLSVTSGMAKGILTRPDQLHISYVLTPPRYLYSHASHYRVSLATPLLEYLRWWDQAAAYRPDKVIPISQLVARRYQEYYGRRPDEVIYPPVDPLVTQPGKAGDYYLAISRLVSYKRLDVAIQACLETNRRLVVIGDGPDKVRLQRLARHHPLISFPGPLPESEVASWLKNCRAVVMPGIEDFGITACEAVASGKPVILHRDSGAAELIPADGQGVHLAEATVPAMKQAFTHLEKTTFDSAKLQQNMRKYATTSFVKNWQSLIERLL